MSLVPLALVLAILIASLMTFGNLGERLELLAMKSAGIPLYRIMKPIFVAVVLLAGSLFVFQNDFMITSQVKFWQYYFSIRNKSPELAIPEGVFYREMPGYSIYVKRKDHKTKLLHDIMIYDTKEGFANASVMVADSGRIFSTNDNRMLILRLFHGESFKNLRRQSYTNLRELIPYLRESFEMKEIHINFDSNMDMLDESILSSQFVGKNIFQLKSYTDSLSLEVDSVQKLNEREVLKTSYWHKHTESYADNTPETSKGENSAYPLPEQTKREGAEKASTPERQIQSIPQKSYPALAETFPSLQTTFDKLPLSRKGEILQAAIDMINTKESNLFFNRSTQEEMENVLRKNLFEYYRKMTYPVACLIMFFIGAPLGAIIRKGGMGTPIVTAVLFFIVYYILESVGWKMASEGKWEIWSGMWLPTIVLAPIGIWLSWIATKDSAKINIDTYVNIVKKIIGTDTTRKIEYKEVTMTDPDYEKALAEIRELSTKAEKVLQMGTLSYTAFFLSDHSYERRKELFLLTERIVSNLHDSRDHLLIHKLSKVPFLRDLSRTMRTRSKSVNIALMLLFPLGLIIYTLYAIRNRAYLKEVKGLQHTVKDVSLRIHELKSTP